jgi:hypothetical protein
VHARIVGSLETGREVVGDETGAVADAVHGGEDLAVALDGYGPRFVGREDGDQVGPLAHGGPSLVERVVVPQRDERGDASVGQLAEPRRSSSWGRTPWSAPR